MRCVCSHNQAHHLNYQDGCIHWLVCNCVAYHPDDGSEVGTTSVDHRADPYSGIYGSDRHWEKP